MPGLPSVHLMLSQELGQMIFDADKKEEFNGIVDLERITALAEEQHKKWPVIPSPQFPHPRTSTDCIEYGPLIFGNSGRPIAHCTVKAGIVCPVEHVGKHKADPKPVLVWVKDRAGTVRRPAPSPSPPSLHELPAAHLVRARAPLTRPPSCRSLLAWRLARSIRS